MTPEEYWKRINLAEQMGLREPGEAAARAIRYIQWSRQRRERRRKITRAIAGGAFAGVGAVLLITSLSSVRGVKTDRQVASTSPPRAAEPSPAVPAPEVSTAAPEETPTVVASPVERQEAASAAHDVSAVPSRPQAPRVADGPALPERAPSSASRPTREHSPSDLPPAVIAADAPRMADSRPSAQPQAPPPQLTAPVVVTPPVPVTPPSLAVVPPHATAPVVVTPSPPMAVAPPQTSSRPRATAEPRPAAPRQGWQEQTLDRLKRAIALTPAETQRLEKIKETLRHLPETPVAKQVVDFVKSLPPADPSGPSAPYERREGRRPETP